MKDDSVGETRTCKKLDKSRCLYDNSMDLSNSEENSYAAHTMSKMERLRDSVRERVNGLNRLYGREPTDYDDFAFFVAPRENILNGKHVRLSRRGEPIGSNELRWIVILVNNNDLYLISRDICEYMASGQPNVDSISIPLCRMTKIIPLVDESDTRASLIDENTTQREEIVRLRDENTCVRDEKDDITLDRDRLRVESDGIREELKRKRKEDIPVAVRQCKDCETELPLSSFVSSCKRVNKEGVAVKCPTTRRICHACRYKKTKSLKLVK